MSTLTEILLIKYGNGNKKIRDKIDKLTDGG